MEDQIVFSFRVGEVIRMKDSPRNQRDEPELVGRCFKVIKTYHKVTSGWNIENRTLPCLELIDLVTEEETGFYPWRFEKTTGSVWDFEF